MHRLVLGLLCELIRSHVNNVKWIILCGFIAKEMTAMFTDVEKLNAE